MTKPPVPGTNGTIGYFVKRKGRGKEEVPEGTPNAKMEKCYSWMRDTGGPNEFHCENPGHWSKFCPHRSQPQVNAVQPVQKAVPMAAGVTMSDLNAQLGGQCK